MAITAGRIFAVERPHGFRACGASDLVAIDGEAMAENAAHEKSGQTASGIAHVLVNGQAARKIPTLTGTHFGRFISHG